MSIKHMVILCEDHKDFDFLVKELSNEAVAGKPFFTRVPAIDGYVAVVCTSEPVMKWKALQIWKQYAKKEDIPI